MRAEPIDKVIAEPSRHSADAAHAAQRSARRARLRLARAGSAGQRAAIAPTRISTRPFVVWNVVAAPEFSVEPQRWCFPDRRLRRLSRLLQRKRRRGSSPRTLKSKGFDVFVGGVPAYSTLGKFADPVLNTMLGYGDDELAAIIFHELSHQLVYVAGDSEFNEAFAIDGRTGGPGALAEAARARDRARALQGAARAAAAVSSRCSRARARSSRTLYEQKLAPETMRERKRADLRVAGYGDRRAGQAIRRALGLSRLDRSRAQQRTPRVGGHVLRLRAGIRAPARAATVAICRSSTQQCGS